MPTLTLPTPPSSPHARAESASRGAHLPPITAFNLPTSDFPLPTSSIPSPPLPHSPNLVSFDPAPDIASKILHDLSDPDLTIRDIACRAQTDLDTFTAWLSRPDIAQRVAEIQSACAMRVRLTATVFLPGAVKTANRLIDAYHDEESSAPINPSSLQGREHRRRARESARKACLLLLRLARFHPASPIPDRGGGSSVPQAARPDLHHAHDSHGRPGCLCRPSRAPRTPDTLESLLTRAAALLPELQDLAPSEGADRASDLCNLPPSSQLSGDPALQPRSEPENDTLLHAHDESASRGARLSIAPETSHFALPTSDFPSLPAHAPSPHPATPSPIHPVTTHPP